MYEETRDQLLAKGRQMCPHEQMADPSHQTTLGEAGSSARSCPVVIGIATGKTAADLVESAAGSVSETVEI